jgi:two-component system chemotaxis response regulator CheY
MTSILIVDDSSFARSRLKNIFERAGHTVVGGAANGEQALSLYDKLQPDFITLDYLMTGKNGEQVLQDIISHDPNARVIMISGSGNKTIESRAMAAGAKLFVEKFNGHSVFLNAIDQVMRA